MLRVGLMPRMWKERLPYLFWCIFSFVLLSESFWVSFRINCSVYSCTFCVSVWGGELWHLLCHHLVISEFLKFWIFSVKIFTFALILFLKCEVLNNLALDKQFSHSVMFNSLKPRGLQHTSLPCPSPIPRACSNSCPLNQWCHPTISSSLLPSPAFNLFLHQVLFQWISPLHQVAKV